MATRSKPVSGGFAPIENADITTLILGSLPSRRSIAERQYYAHPRNAFWRIMGELVGAGLDLPYAARTARLLGAGIGVWDVLRSSVRPGSMDADIDLRSATANDFASFLEAHASIRRICFNGRTAASLFRRFDCMPVSGALAEIERVTLPSTSAAFAAMPFDEKVSRWSILLRAPVGGGPSAPS